MRNVRVDLLKVLFAVLIVVTHTIILAGPFYPNYGFLAVEFFFICTGYFLAENVKKNKDNPISTGSFIKKKILVFLPYFIVAEIMAVFLMWLGYSIVGNNYDLYTLLHDYVWSITDLSLLSMTGLPVFGRTGISWYFSAMILGSAILYPIVKKFPDFKTAPCAVIGVLLIGLIYVKVGTLSDPLAIVLGLPCGLLRGIGGICLGIFANYCVERFKERTISNRSKASLTIVEILLLCVCVLYMCLYNRSSGEDNFHIVIIIFIWILIVLVFSDMSYLSKITISNNLIASKLGIVSLLLILNHCWIFSFVRMIYPNDLPGIQLLYSIIGIIASVVACYYFGKILDRFIRKIDLKKTVEHG